MVTRDFKYLTESVIKSNKEYEMTVRQLVAAFFHKKRSKYINFYIDKYLQDNGLEVVPHFTDTGFDSKVKIRKRNN